MGGQNLPARWGQCKERPPDCSPCYEKASQIPGDIQVLQRTNSSGFNDPASPGQPRLCWEEGCPYCKE